MLTDCMQNYQKSTCVRGDFVQSHARRGNHSRKNNKITNSYGKGAKVTDTDFLELNLAFVPTIECGKDFTPHGKD